VSKGMRHYAAVMLAPMVLLGGCATAGGPVASATPGPIAIHGNTSTFEISPVFLAARDYYPAQATVKMGGIPNLVGEPTIAGFGEAGVADVATHAETQALRYSVRNPNLRIILNISQGLYRIVARRSAGIENIADLAGKRVATIPTTSSGYFLSRMLGTAGLTYDDIEVTTVSPLDAWAQAIDRREVDAVVIWEPYSEQAARVLGDDLIEFDGEGVYNEWFNLNTTAENLADPAQRAKIVTFVRAVMDAAAVLRTDPTQAQALVVERGGFTSGDVRDAWKHHAFPANLPAEELLAVLVEEERWLAERDSRPARSRDELATLIDTSVYQEALALGSGR